MGSKKEGITRKPVKLSEQFLDSVDDIFNYGIFRYGDVQAEIYNQEIMDYVHALPYSYLQWQECWYLPTKSKMYRRIPMAAHHIVYRVTSRRIEVLDIIHQASSVSRFRAVRKIRL